MEENIGSRQQLLHSLQQLLQNQSTRETSTNIFLGVFFRHQSGIGHNIIGHKTNTIAGKEKKYGKRKVYVNRQAKAFLFMPM